MQVPQAPLRQPYGSTKSALAAASSTVSSAAHANAWPAGFMVTSNVMCIVVSRAGPVVSGAPGVSAPGA